MTKLKNLVVFAFLSLGFIVQIFAQQSTVFTTEIADFKRGLELYDKEKFGAAFKQFEQVINQFPNEYDEVRVNAEYFHALCAMNLFNRDADFLLREFVRKHPESPLVKKAYFQLGNYNYRKKQYDKTIEWFNKVDEFELTQNETYEFFYKKGYSYFQIEKYEESSQALFKIKDVENPYNIPATYYYGHIAYQNENNQTALENFKKLEQNELFGSVVPYYIAQILFKQQKFDELLVYGKPLLNSNTKRVEEIARLLGESYYAKKQYTEAIPYLEQYLENTKTATSTDKYQLGFCYYQVQNLQKAIDVFSKLSVYEDELGQLSLYHLADCFLKTNDKPSARNAFIEAYKMGYDEKITENALFNYAKLSYDLKFDPYAKSISAFKKFIEEYPNSEHLDEAYDFLMSVYLTTKNYDEALNSIEQIKNLDIRLQEAYQKIAFNKAIEVYQNRQYSNAIAYFEKSQKYAVNKNLNTLSYYWIGEAYYRLAKYNQAINNYKTYLYEPLAFLQKEFNLGQYSLGYAYFEKKDYANAETWFRKFIYHKAETDTMRIADAYLRIGDSFFIRKEYLQCLEYYEKAAQINKLDADYALYQMAMAVGIVKNLPEKAKTLELLKTNYPNSKYADVTLYQLGRTYLLIGKEDKAVENLQLVITNHPNSIYVKNALVSTGLIYYNRSENDKALSIFKQIVAEYPNYEDSKEALTGIKNIYIETGRVNEYAEFMKQVSFVNITQSALDSATYQAAELNYLNSNFSEAIAGFTHYLNTFKPANFSLNAHFYRADCYYRDTKFEEALTDYEAVIAFGQSKFYELALQTAAQITFQADLFQKNVQFAELLEPISTNETNRLNAIIYLMKGYHALNNHEKALINAQKVISVDKIDFPVKMEANIIAGMALLNLADTLNAQTYFKLVSEQTTAEYGAQAKYHLAEISFNNNQPDTAKNYINAIVSQVPSYDYWIAKGLILLADIFTAAGDTFQAKATLTSIVDNYEGDAMLLQVAENKLQKLIDANKPTEQVQEEEIEIDFEGIDEQMLLLFDEEPEVDEIIPVPNDKK